MEVAVNLDYYGGLNNVLVGHSRSLLVISAAMDQIIKDINLEIT